MFCFARRLFVTVLFAVCGLGRVCWGQYEDNSYWNKVYSADQAIFVHRPTALLPKSGVKTLG